MGVQCQSLNVRADLSTYDILIIGKAALTVDGPGPDASRVREGLKVIVFEQTAEVLEKRFGFRVAEYGLRQVFKRVPDHPTLAGLDADKTLEFQSRIFPDTWSQFLRIPVNIVRRLADVDCRIAHQYMQARLNDGQGAG